MKVFIHSYDRAELNLAYEEWLFSAFEEEVIRLWINPQAVVVGKHQNAMAEANVHYCRKLDIPVLRRISGGGTVYHDPGNINFSFFRKVNRDKMIDYDRNLHWIHGALRQMGYPVDMNERHDLFLGDHKVSGNAQHLRKGRALHHGTILYDADRTSLSESIKRLSGSFEDKSVQSVRSPITNLRPTEDIGTAHDFMATLQQQLINKGAELVVPPKPQEGELNQMLEERYTRESWNFGYSPAYRYANGNAQFSVEMDVLRGGAITKGTITSSSNPEEVETIDLVGRNHFPSEMDNVVTGLQLKETTKQRLREILY